MSSCKSNRNSRSSGFCDTDEVRENCGINIDLKGTELSKTRSNLVYLDKVFSFNEAESCPLFLGNINVGEMSGFRVFFETEDRRNRCSCDSCIIDERAEFIVEKTNATLDFIAIKPPGNIDASQVTICGENPDSIQFANHRYMINAAPVTEAAQKMSCLDKGEPSRCMFLIQNAGPWEFRATFALTGLVNSQGRTCRFRAVFTNADGPMCTLPGRCANFAIPDLAVPCSINGVAPDINFQFSGCIDLLDPRLLASCCNAKGPKSEGADPTCRELRGMQTCMLNLCTNLIVVPKVNVEVVRKTLFSVNSAEVLLPCDQAGEAILSFEKEPCETKQNLCCKPTGTICNNIGHCSNPCQSSRSAFQYLGCNGCSW